MEAQEAFLPYYHYLPGTQWPFSHIPLALVGTFPCRPVAGNTPRPSRSPTRALLTSVAVHSHAGADRVALADAVGRPAVGDTLVLLADARWKGRAAVSADAPGQAAGHPAAPPPAARRAGRRDKAAPHRTEPAGVGTRTPPLPTSPPALPWRRTRPFLRDARAPPRPLGPWTKGRGDRVPLPPSHPSSRRAAPRARQRPRAPGGGGAPFCGAAWSGAPTGAAPRAAGGREGRQDEEPRPAGGSAGRTEGCGHSRFCWAQAAAQSSRRSAAPQSGFMARSGGGVRRGRGKVLRGAGGGDGAVCARRRTDVSRPTGSAGGGGCAAPSRLWLHLGRAGGGGGGSSSPAGRARS